MAKNYKYHDAQPILIQLLQNPCTYGFQNIAIEQIDRL